jgi:hypothetical protein
LSQENQFEVIFREFVREFGGEVLAERPGAKMADFLFRAQNVVAELKCLVVDQTEEMNRRLTEVVKEAAKTNEALLSLFDYPFLEIAKAPKEISDPWLNILTAPLENVVRYANRQIRSTKEELDLPSAKGLLLIFNQDNQLHVRPHDFRLLIAKILRKKTSDGQLRFAEIDGVVFFSFETVKSEKQGMSFWAPMQIQRKPEDDLASMKMFQKDLQQGWYRHVEKITGRPVRQHVGER